MAKYRLAWMPGDGVGTDVKEAAKIVLDAMKLDEARVHAGASLELADEDARNQA